MSSPWRSLLDALRRLNHQRLERRRRRKAAMATSGPSGGLRGWNRRRLERRHAIPRALEALTANDTAVLEALVYLVEAEQARAAEAGASQGALQERLEGLAIAQREAGQALAEMGRSQAALLERLAPGPQESGQQGSGQLAARLQTGRAALLEPELDLVAHLAPSLPWPVALDVGAHLGAYAEALLDLGLEVHAFEPCEPTRRRLVERLGGRSGFHVRPEAVGAEDGERPLHLVVDSVGGFGDPGLYSSLLAHALPDGLRFQPAGTVPVRSLASLHRSGAIPAQAGLLKVDAEGWDLEVLRGMGEQRYPVVVAEYWDPAMAFATAGARNRLADMTAEMRRRGYPWTIVLQRIWGDGVVTWYPNRAESAEQAWGNVFFFRDEPLFEQARRWCAATLPAASFVPLASPGPGAPKGT